MSLNQCVLFPGAILPLYLFEERYQRMIDDVLAEGRTFAMVNRNDALEREGKGGHEPMHEVGTMGLVRVCKRLPNGHAHVVLEGVSRIRVQKVVRETPYRVVMAEPLTPGTEEPDESTLTALRERLEQLLEVRARIEDELPPEIFTQLRGIHDAGSFVDLVAATLCDDSQVRQLVLETIDLPARYRMVTRSIQEDNERRFSDQID